MSEVADGYVDYDYTPPSSGGKYLNLSNKGESVRVRLVGRPYQHTDTFQDGKTALRFSWKVIHKENINGKVVRTAKVFKTSTMVFNAVADLHKDEDWGNPENYDIEVTRTEEKGKYYVVVPKPNGKPLTDEDRDLVADLGELEELVKGKPGETTAKATAPGDEYDPFADE